MVESGIKISNEDKKIDSLDGFVCETHPYEDGKIVHYLHNPVTGVWKKSEVCKN